jgi:putative N6-adenine-specific DNA methylase
VLAAQFRARSFAELERRTKGVPWSEWLREDAQVQLRVTCRKSKLYHSVAVAERVAGAIVARTRARIVTGESDDGHSGQLVLVRLFRDECTIRIDSSGEHLHRRGYRQAVAKAPLRETLAAAMILGSRWNSTDPLVDPFCGSGTVAIEGALLALNVAPGARREFAFTHWPNFDAASWRETLARAESRRRPRSAAPILGFDRDAGAIDAAHDNAARAGVSDHVEFVCQPLSALTPPANSGWVVTNPPYGVRMGDRERLRDLYAALGRLAGERLSGWHVAVLSADRALDAQIAPRMEQIFRTTNGGLDVRLVMRVPLGQAQGMRKTVGNSLGMSQGSSDDL